MCCKVNGFVFYRTEAPWRVFIDVFVFFPPGELYFMSTGVPSATAPHGVVYKVVDTSRYEMKPKHRAVCPDLDVMKDAD